MLRARASHFALALRPAPAHVDGAAILGEMRRAIRSGNVAPGAVIWVDEVAEFFGVSPIPVREALKTLMGERLVIHRPRAGYSVAQSTMSEHLELYVVCEALELAALPVAIERATAADDTNLTRIIDRAQAAFDSGDEVSLAAEVKAFHAALIAPSGMQRLLGIVESTWHMTEPGQPLVHVDPTITRAIHGEHRRQYDAFVARDIDTLTALTREHYRTLYASIQAVPDDRGVFRSPGD